MLNTKEEVLYLTDDYIAILLSQFAEFVCLEFLNKLIN
jgi:hypothetical protein